MKRVFIQSYCKYPRGGALANYIENFAKAVSNAGYHVILVSDINPDYKDIKGTHFECYDMVYEIAPSVCVDEQKEQREKGFAAERLDALKQEKICNKDVVIVLGITNKYMLEKLFEYRNQIGFKIVCAVFEMYGFNDFNNVQDYEYVKFIKEEVYVRADAILSISTWIDNFYEKRGVKTYRVPPLIDADESNVGIMRKDKYSFVIPTIKDSFAEVLMAFAGLTQTELQKVEVHICNSDRESILKLLPIECWNSIEGVTICHEWMTYEELVELYKNMQFLIVARKECQRTLANFPSKVPECMNMGIVPIVSDVGDYTKYYLKDEENSIFIKSDEVSDIIVALRKAIRLDEEGLRWYSENVKKFARDRFDFRIWKEHIREMINGV